MKFEIEDLNLELQKMLNSLAQHNQKPANKSANKDANKSANKKS